MHKRFSALDSNYLSGKYPFNNNTNIIFKECNNLNINQISCWPNNLIEMEKIFQKELKVNNPPVFNRGSVKKDFSLWRMEPLKWWLLDKNINLSEDLGTILDMSHAFTCIHISGNDSSLLLNRHLPIDLRDNVFPKSSSASSAIHHVSIKLLKLSGNNYHLFIPRGFALSIWEILLETAKQFGYEILER